MMKGKYTIALNDFERRIVVNCLNELRNHLIADGKETSDIDCILLKIIDSKKQTKLFRRI